MSDRLPHWLYCSVWQIIGQKKKEKNNHPKPNLDYETEPSKPIEARSYNDTFPRASRIDRRSKEPTVCENESYFSRFPSPSPTLIFPSFLTL